MAVVHVTVSCLMAIAYKQLPATPDTGWQQGELKMAQDTSGTGAAPGGTALVIPGEIAARVDRLPMSFMAWEICLIVQIGWACAASTDGIAARMYPYVWLPAKVIDHSQYNVLYALQAGISILIGGYALGWLADKIGRRPTLILSALLAGVFIWPFAYVTNYAALFVLSIADTLGFAGFLAINVVYMSEIMGPTVRPRVMMVSQVVCIFMLEVVLIGIVPHYWFPSQYHAYLWLLAGLNILIAIALFFRMPESPRWLEARDRRDQARKVIERMEARASQGGRITLPEPDLAPYQVVAEEKTSWLAVFGKQYVVVTVFLLVVMALGYGGIVYGGASQSFLFLSLTRGYSAGFVFAVTAWGGAAASVVYLLNAFFGDRFERKWTQLVGAVLFAGSWWGLYEVHSTAGVVTFFILTVVGTVLWLWSMYVYIPNNYPTRMRSPGTGWTDGVGHLGAWGGVLIAGQLFVANAPRSFIVFITIPCALVPGLLVAIFGKNQRHRALEELAR
jgi:putative MFS transporter